MIISKEILDELLKDYKGLDDITGPEGLLKQLTKAVIERAMQVELTEQLGYEKSDLVNNHLQSRWLKLTP
jgi:putative transposase